MLTALTERQYLIEQITELVVPNYFKVKSSVNFGLCLDDEQKNIQKQSEEVKGGLQHKSEIELKRMLKNEKIRIEEETLKRMMDEDEFFEFNLPSFRADLEVWCKKGRWKWDDGVALLLIMDPNKVNWDSIKKHVNKYHTAKKYADLRDLFFSTAEYHSNPDWVEPHEFAKLAVKIYKDVPEEIRRIAEQCGSKEKDQSEIRMRDLEVALREAVEERDRLKDRIEGMLAFSRSYIEDESLLEKAVWIPFGAFTKRLQVGSILSLDRLREPGVSLLSAKLHLDAEKLYIKYGLGASGDDNFKRNMTELCVIINPSHKERKRK